MPMDKQLVLDLCSSIVLTQNDIESLNNRLKELQLSVANVMEEYLKEAAEAGDHKEYERLRNIMHWGF